MAGIAFGIPLSACLLSGCASKETIDLGDQKPFDTSQPDLSNTTIFLLPAGGPYGHTGAKSASIRLRKGTRLGEIPFVFISRHQAYISVFPEALNPRQEARMKKLQSGNPDIDIDGWIGDCTRREIRGGARMAWQCEMYSPKSVYSFMVSWPEDDATARAEARDLERDVIWSYQTEGR